MSRDWDLDSSLTGLLVGLVAVTVLVDLLAALAPGLLWRLGVSGGLLRRFLAAMALGAVGVGFALGSVRHRAYAAGTLAASPLVVVYVLTGVIIQWDQLSFFLTQWLLELCLGVPLVGEPLAVALFGGVTLTEQTLQNAVRIHYGLAGLAAVGLVGALVVRYRRTR